MTTATAAESIIERGSREHWHSVLDAIFDSGNLFAIDAVRSHLTICAEVANASREVHLATGDTPASVPPGAVDISTGRRPRR